MVSKSTLVVRTYKTKHSQKEHDFSPHLCFSTIRSPSILLPLSCHFSHALFPDTSMQKKGQKRSTSRTRRHKYIYIYIYVYIHTYIQTYIHTYIHVYIYIYMCSKNGPRFALFCVKIWSFFVVLKISFSLQKQEDKKATKRKRKTVFGKTCKF